MRGGGGGEPRGKNKESRPEAGTELRGPWPHRGQGPGRGLSTRRGLSACRAGVIVKYLTQCGAPGRGRAGKNAAHGRLLLKLSFAEGKAVLPAPAGPEGGAGGSFLCKISVTLPHSTPNGVFQGLGWNGDSTLNGTFRSLGWNKRRFFDKCLTMFLLYSTPNGVFWHLGWNVGSTLNATFQGLGWS